MQKVLFFSLTFLGLLANAASGGHGDDHIPLSTIGWQCFNLTLVGVIIYFATRKSVPEIFRQRQSGFLATAKKADQAKAEAQKQFVEMQQKLSHLKSTYEESLARAHAEAADMKKQMLAEAQEQAKRIRGEADVTVKIELQKAQHQLHEHFVKESVGLAREVLTRDIATTDHQKLQSEFARNIEAVTP